MNSKKSTDIVHVDGDAFFVACEVARLPHLRGRPVVVGEERGIVSALSYEAKALGIVRGMPIFQLADHFPDVVILPSHFDLYTRYANYLYEILETKCARVERYSIDECFAEMAHFESRNEGLYWLQGVQNELLEKLDVSYSLGIASTKTLAKIASKRHKPKGVFVIDEANRQRVLKGTPIESVWGIGKAGVAQLGRFGAKTALDAVEFMEMDKSSQLPLTLSRTISELNGCRHFMVTETNPHQKSLQVTRSFLATSSDVKIMSELMWNLEQVISSLHEQELYTNVVTCYLKESRRGGLNQIHQVTVHLSCKMNAYEHIVKEVVPKVEELCVALKKRNILCKTTGVIAYCLTTRQEVQNDLFMWQEDEFGYDTKEETAIHALRRKFGSHSIVRAVSLLAAKTRHEDSQRRDRRSSYLTGLPYPYMGDAA